MAGVAILSVSGTMSVLAQDAPEVLPLVECARPDQIALPLEHCMAEEAYWSAQWAMQSSAAEALDKVNARFAQGSGPLAQLARDLDDGREALRSIESDYYGALALGDSALKEQLLADIKPRLEEATSRIAATESALAAAYPDYANLIVPQPLTVAETQALLGPDEALVMVLPGETGAFVFFVARDGLQWHRSAMTRPELAILVDELRLSMGVDGVQPGVRAIGGFAPAFDRSLAFDLYTGLFGPLAEDMENAEHLYVVAAGPLSAFPMGALVTSIPEGDDEDAEAMRRTRWLIRSVALTVIPAPSSLRALAEREASAATLPFLGIGNACTGWGVRGAPEPPADLCGGIEEDALIEAKQAVQASTSARGLGFSKPTRAGRVAVLSADELRFSISYLPGTRAELMTISSLFGADPIRDLIMAQEATESRLKGDEIALSDRRVIVFATHGLIATDGIDNLDEPGLVLTPPEVESAEDDGFLTTSEIAAFLELDADFVVLSACNTASPAKSGADSLSGLATAFFYAGARAILVSHWPVQDDIAPRITAGTIERFNRAPDRGRARALQETLFTLMDDPETADPYYWAPFALVGQN